jgi:hypothetical protein
MEPFGDFIDSGGWDSEVGIGIRCGLEVRGSHPGAGEIFSAVQTSPEASKPPVKWEPGLSPGIKRAENCADYAPLSSAGLRMRWNYTSASPLCLHRHVMG